MYSREVFYKSEEILGALRVKVIFEKAVAYKCKLYVESGTKKAPATSLMGLLQLGIKKGDKLVISGEGAEAAVNELCSYIESL